MVTENFTPAAGPPVTLELDGSAFATGLQTGVTEAPAGAPAAVSPELGFAALDAYEVTVDGGTKRTVVSAAPDFARPGSDQPEELAAALRREFARPPADRAQVFVTSRNLGVRLTATGGGRVVFAGTAREALGLPADVPAADRPRSATTAAQAFDVRAPSPPPPPPPPLTLTIGDGTNTSASLSFGPLIPGQLHLVWAVQLLEVLRAHLAANPTVAVRADLAVVGDLGRVNEITYSPSSSDTAIVGATDNVWIRRGQAHRWLPIGDPDQAASRRDVEAVAVHPEDDQVIYVGYDSASGTSSSLYKTLDGGRSWDSSAVGLTRPIKALEVDPAQPDVVYAATLAGVYRSDDRGQNWALFVAGLPNADPRDLASIPHARLLRAAVWGRGVWERELGDRPPRDVSLYHRATISDIGLEGPPRRGFAAFAPFPSPEALDESPDVRISRRVFAADDFWSSADFDRLVVPEPVADGDANLFLRIHNRGPFPATAVKTSVLWAPAASAPPPIPSAVLTAIADGRLSTLPEADLGEWHILSEFDIPRVSNHRSEVRSAVVTFPANVASHRRVGLLVLSQCADDGLDTSASTVPDLLVRERKAAYVELPALPSTDTGRVALVSTDGQPFELTARRAVHRTNLGLATGAATSVVGTTTAPFDLSAGTDTTGGIRLVTEREHEVFFPVEALDRDGRPNPQSTVSVAEAIRILNHYFTTAGIPLQSRFGVDSAGLGSLMVFGIRGATLRIEGNARTTFGFSPTVPFLAERWSDPGLFDLQPTAAGVERRLRFLIRHTIDIPFLAEDVVDRSAVTADEARSIIGAELALSSAPIAVVIPQVDLRIGQSSSDADGAAVAEGGGHLAEIVVRPAAVATNAARAGLFRAISLFEHQSARTASIRLYLRSMNRGVVGVVDARHRLFLMNPPAAPVQIDGDPAATIEPGGFAVTEFEWTPGAPLAGSTQFLLAVADRPGVDEITIAELTALATFDDVIGFCHDHPNAAYRTIVVA